MTKKHRQNLKNRKSSPFNVLSKDQENIAKIASDMVWKTIIKKYPNYHGKNYQIEEPPE